MLHYKEWLFEKKPSILTKLWGGLVKYGFMQQSVPALYTYQGALPKQPVPSIRATCDKYLSTVKPLLEPKEYDVMVQQVERIVLCAVHSVACPPPPPLPCACTALSKHWLGVKPPF